MQIPDNKLKASIKLYMNIDKGYSDSYIYKGYLNTNNIVTKADGQVDSNQHLEVPLYVLQMFSSFHDPELQS